MDSARRSIPTHDITLRDVITSQNLTPVADTSLKGLKSILGGAKDGFGIGKDALAIEKDLEGLFGFGGNGTKRSYEDLKARHVALSQVLERQNAAVEDLSVRSIANITHDALDVLGVLLGGLLDDDVITNTRKRQDTTVSSAQATSSAQPVADVSTKGLKDIFDIGKDAFDILDGLFGGSSSDSSTSSSKRQTSDDASTEPSADVSLKSVKTILGLADEGLDIIEGLFGGSDDTNTKRDGTTEPSADISSKSLKSIFSAGQELLDIIDGLVGANGSNNKRQETTATEPSADISPKTILSLGKDALELLSSLFGGSGSSDDNGN